METTVGVLSWLFGRRNNPTQPVKLGQGTNPSSRYAVEVDGESRYQDALDRICGGRTKAGHKLEVPASLVLEYGGPHAPKAIRVDIDGQTVGYVERKAARTLWQKVAEAGLTSEAVTCDAIIVGGWDRGEGDSGYYGVKLDLPTTQAPAQPFRTPRSPSQASRSHQKRRKPRSQQHQWGNRQRRRKPIPSWLPVAALVGVTAVVYIGSEFLPIIGGGPSNEIVGRASVIDGDTLEIQGTRIRFHGIDAPESSQSCSVNDQMFRCGQQAALALSDKIGNRTVACEPRDKDQYGRIVAVCRAGGEDLNKWMVAQGWALAYRKYSTAYVEQESNASAAKLGIWQGEFVDPWEWRRGKRL